MKLSRRQLITAATAAAAVPMAMNASAQTSAGAPPDDVPESARVNRVGVTTLNGRSLPYRMVNGVKEFHLIAEEIEHEFAPGQKIKAWGYNGSTPGPTIEAV